MSGEDDGGSILLLLYISDQKCFPLVCENKAAIVLTKNTS